MKCNTSFCARLLKTTIPVHACFSSYFLLIVLQMMFLRYPFLIIQIIYRCKLQQLISHVAVKVKWPKRQFDVIFIIQINFSTFFLDIFVGIFEIESKPFQASPLSHDNSSSQPLTLVSQRLQSKGSALHCDLLSGPTAEGSGGRIKCSHLKSEAHFGQRYIFFFFQRLHCSHYCKKSHRGLNDSIFMSGLMNSCRNRVCGSKLILNIYQC